MEHMTPDEIKLLEGFFKDLGERMGNAGCNDMELPNNPQNRTLVTNAYRHGMSAEDFEDWQYGKRWVGQRLIVEDFIILDYLKHKALSILRASK